MEGWTELYPKFLVGAKNQVDSKREPGVAHQNISTLQLKQISNFKSAK